MYKNGPKLDSFYRYPYVANSKIGSFLYSLKDIIDKVK